MRHLNYIWTLILGFIEDIMPWIYALIIVAVMVMILSTAIGFEKEYYQGGIIGLRS